MANLTDTLVNGSLRVTGLIYGNAPTAPAGTNTTQIASTAFVQTAINNLPEPMVFKGTLGTGGTITALPTAAATNEGHTYKVITAGTYASTAAKVGDTFISTGSKWELIPSGDEPSGTVTSVKIEATSPIAISSSDAITTSGTRTISHATSGVTAGTYNSVTVNATGHVTGGTNPTTLSGYGITDAKIENGVITLGSSTITPVTDVSGKQDVLTFDGTYNASSNKVATQTTVTNAVSSAKKYANHAWGGDIRSSLAPLDTYLFFRKNALFGIPENACRAEYSTDGGTTWVDFNLTNETKKLLFSATDGASLSCGNNEHVWSGCTASSYASKAHDLTTDMVSNQRLRITIACCSLASAGTGSCTGVWMYGQMYRIGIYMSTQSVRDVKCKITARRRVAFKAGTDEWLDRGTYTIAGDSGWNSVPYEQILGQSYDQQDTEIRLEIYGSSLSSTPVASQSGNPAIYKVCMASAFQWVNNSTDSTIAQYGGAACNPVYGYWKGKYESLIDSSDATFVFKPSYRASSPTSNADNAYFGIWSVNGSTETLKAIKASDMTVGTAKKVANGGNGTTDVNRHVWFSSDTAETTRVSSDSFMYNPAKNILTVGGITGNAATASAAESGSALETAISGKVTANTAITGATKTKVTYDSKGLVTAGADVNEDDIAPLATKTFTGMLASSNTNGSGADFMMLDLTPAAIPNIFKLKLRVEAQYTRSNDSVVYTSVHDCLIYGCGNGSICSAMWNNIRNTSYRPFYYLVAYRPSSATANWVIGLCMYNCNNNTTSGNTRSATIKVMSTENCTVAFHETTANTDYTTYYKSMAGRNTYDICNNGLRESGDDNSTTNVMAYDISGISWTGAGTAAKYFDMARFTLRTGIVVRVYNSYANTYAGALTLNVNNTGAKTIYTLTASNTWTVTSSSNYSMPAGSYDCYYNGSYWYIQNTSGRSGQSVDNAILYGQAGYAIKNVFVNGYKLVKGATFKMYVETANTSATALKLNVNVTGEKPLYINNAATSTSSYALTAGWYTVYYDGTNYYANTTAEMPVRVDWSRVDNHPTDFLTGGSQTSTSTADGGDNVFTFTKSDGTSATFTVKNGNKGSTGSTGTRGNKWFSGSLFTGTSTTTGAYSSENFTDTAIVGDMYLNTSTTNPGTTYQCTTAGTGTTAKWTYKGSVRGAAGSKGDTGSTGTRGNKWFSGSLFTGTSTTTGEYSSASFTDTAIVGDMYLNTSATNPGTTYQCTTAGTGATAKWTYKGTIRGAAGSKGDTGSTGTRGNKWFSGSLFTGTSTTTGEYSSANFTDTAIVGDMYLNTSTTNPGTTYQCTTAGTGTTAKWTYKGTIRGAAGTKGDTGSTGTRGNKWFSGSLFTGTSTTTGEYSSASFTDTAIVGDMYLNTSATNPGTTYQCTTAGTGTTAKWTYKGTIRGASGTKGDTGATGTRGNRWFSGSLFNGTSTTTGEYSSASFTDTAIVGDMYLNTSTTNPGTTYQCTTAGTGTTAKWTYKGTIRGASGAKGDTGSTGTRGNKWFSGSLFTGKTTTTDAYSSASFTDTAIVGDMYLNTSATNPGTTYQCTTAGTGATAKWTYKGTIRGADGLKGDTGATGSVASVTVTGSGNAVTTASLDSSTKVLTLTKGTTFSTTDEKQKVTLATTTKTYLTGVSTAPTTTATALTALADTGVYLTTTAGQVNATSYKVNEKATFQYNATENSIDLVW